MRLLFINGNTTPSITDLIAREARRVARPDSEIVGVTARFGPRYIASRAGFAVAGHAVLDAFAEHGAGADAIVIACFGDPALAALREVAPVPVTGMADAACHEAAREHGRFAIVTGGVAWPAMLTEFVHGIGLGANLVSVRAVAATGAAIAEDQQGARASLVEACRAAAGDGAAAVILGGAGLAGIAPHIAALVPVPLIDGLVASVRWAEAMAGKPGAPASRDGVPSVGLGGSLERLLATKS